MGFLPESNTGIINCRRCGRVFRKTFRPFCPECAEVINETNSRMYAYIDEHPNLSIDEIALYCGVPLRDAELILHEGGLGMTASQVMIHCHQCGREVSNIQRKGHFCMICALKVEEEIRLTAPPPLPAKDKHLIAGPTGKKSASPTRRCEEPVISAIEESTIGTFRIEEDEMRPVAPHHGFVRRAD